MLSRKSAIFLVAFLLLLIIFDAFQQKYYVDNFVSTSQDDPVSIMELLRSHALRWLLWGIAGLPLTLYIRKSAIGPFGNTLSRTFGITLVTLVLALIMVSLVTMVQQEIPWSLASFLEIFEFFCYQKGLTFLMAYGTLLLLLKGEADGKVVAAQSVEIEHLEATTRHLSSALETATEPEQPHINIKVGYQVKPVPLNEVLWIQADDYCARIHTTDKVFTIRKSLKSFEKQLAPFGFIRVHRGALINVDYLDRVNFDEAKLVLRNTEELPISKSGEQTLKKQLGRGAL